MRAMDANVFRIHTDVERRHWWFSARRRILRAVVETVVAPDKDRLIVDIGCGVGANVMAFQPGYRYIGYDPSPDAVRFASAEYPDAIFRAGSAAEAGADLALADLALLTDVIEHVPDDRVLMNDVTRALRPGAYLLVTVPAGMELWSPHDEALGHYRRYDIPMLRRAWQGLPLEPVNVTYFNSRLYLPVRIVRWITSRRRRAAGGAGTDFSIPPKPVNAALDRFFFGEARRVARATDRSAYRRGVSILALLRRTPHAAPTGGSV